MKIQVRFVSFQYKRWQRAVDRLRRTALAEKESLPRRMSIGYIDMIRLNIYSGRYSSTYSRYNERYRRWKYMVFKSSGGFWQLRGELITSLRSYKMKNGWFGGIPANILDSGNVSWLGKGDRGRSIPIAQYAYWLEYGRSGQPARPLFRPTLIEYAQKQGPKKLDESGRKLSGGWQ